MKDPTNFLVISGSQFINNYNVNGGAISLTNVGNATIKDGTLFQGNYVDQAGGALFFYCSDYGLDFSKCSLCIESSIFVNNTAQIQGGAIKWNFYEPSMYNVTFANNTAMVYGQDIASVPKQLLEINSSQLNLTTFTVKQNLPDVNNTVSSGVMIDVQSGGNISLYFTVIDKYGSVVTTDKSSSISIM